MRIESSFSTGSFHGYNIKYSPLRPDLLACAACQNYGIAGRGRLYVLNIENPASLKVISTSEWSHGLFDVTWSENNEKLIVTSCGDGSIQIWDFLIASHPLSLYKIHEKEVYSVDWSPKNSFPAILSASWDNTVKLWDPFAGRQVASFLDHTDQLYEAKFSTHYPTMFSSVSADGTLRLWDIRNPPKANGTYPHGSEVVCCDWAKSDQNIIAVGTTDGKIFGWDIKNMKDPIFVLVGHDYAIRRLKFAPLARGLIVSVSYDFTTRLWDWTKPFPVETHKSHTEFVYGVDFNPSKAFEVCDCAWDSLINLYTGTIPNLQHI